MTKSTCSCPYINPQLAQRILYGEVVPKTIDDWFKKVIQFDTNYRMAAALLGPGPSTGKSPRNETSKGNGNAHWWRPAEKKDPNAMDVDALTMEERATLLRQGKCFRCKKPGHMARDCPPPDQKYEALKKSMDPARFAYTTIKALTREEKEAFRKMVLEDKSDEDF